MNNPDLPPTYINVDDLHAGATIADHSETAWDCGLDPGAIAQFIAQAGDHVKVQAPSDKLFEAGFVWGLSVGVNAEKHKLHREHLENL